MTQLPPLPQEVIDRITSNLDKIDQLPRARAHEIMGKVNGIDALVAAEVYGYVKYYNPTPSGKGTTYVCKSENWKPEFTEISYGMYCNNLAEYIVDKLGMILLSDLRAMLNPKIKHVKFVLDTDKIKQKKVIINKKCRRLLVSQKVHDEMEKGNIPPNIELSKKPVFSKNRTQKDKEDNPNRKLLKDAASVEHEAIRLFLARFPEMRHNLTAYECKYIIKRYEHFKADDFLGMDKHVRATSQVDKMCRLLGWNERTHKPSFRPSIISTEKTRVWA